MKIVLTFAILIGALVMGGCSDNPTNEVSQQQVVDAKAKRAAEIDADPTMPAAQKAAMKKALGLDGASAGQKRP